MRQQKGGMVTLLLFVCLIFYAVSECKARLLTNSVVRDSPSWWKYGISDQGVSCVRELKTFFLNPRRRRQKHPKRTLHALQGSLQTTPLALDSNGALCWCHVNSPRHNVHALVSKLQHRWCRPIRSARSNSSSISSNSSSSSSISSSRTSSSTSRTTRCICEVQTADGASFSSARGSPLVLRFAPSPTGSLHVGGARTALVNYALLQEHLSHSSSGRLILRIEDTDEARNNVNSEQSLIDDLKWLGIKWDEGPDIGGPSGFYRQSERLSIYRHHGRALLERNVLYKCFCTKERLARLRQERTQQGLPPRYDGRCRSLTSEEAERLEKEGKPFALRFRIPSAPDTISFRDGLRGLVTFSLQQTLGDFVCFRPANQELTQSAACTEKPQAGAGGSYSSSFAIESREDDKAFGTPVYNFCAAVDDWLMGVTAVVRGEEHIPNTIAQILLARALRAPILRFCHLPVMLAKEGGKISKRKQISHHALETTSLSFRDRQSLFCDTSSATTAGSKVAAGEVASSSTLTDYTIQGLRRRGYHPEAVVSCLKGHHLEGAQMTGHVSYLAQLGRGSFCFDEQHLLHAHKKKIMQLVKSNDTEPLVRFFCNVLSLAPEVCESTPLGSKTSAALPPGINEDSIAIVREEQPCLFEFMSLAARLLLPQHVAPSAVARELVENLRGNVKPGGDAFKHLLQTTDSEAQQFRLVAAALVASKDVFEANKEDRNECSSGLANENREVREERLNLVRLEGGVVMTFEAWIEQLSKQLNMEKPTFLRLARLALTGRDVGVPLGKLLQLLRLAQLAGFPACSANDSFSLEAKPQHSKGASSRLLCLDWLRRQCFQPLNERLSKLKRILSLP